jgi:regulator of sigma E protease
MGFILTIILIVIFFAVLVLGHEAGHFAVAKLLGLKVDEFGFGFPPKIIGRKFKGTEYTINAIPFGGFVKVPSLDSGSDEYSAVPAWKKAAVFCSGVIMNFFIAWLAFSVIFMIGAPQGVYIGGVIADSPAAESGIKSGDRLSGFTSITEVVDFIGSKADESIVLEVERSGKNISVEVIPRENDGVGRIGVELVESGFERVGFFKGLGSGLSSAWGFTGRIVNAFISMFRHAEFGNSTGPIGIFSAVSVAKDMGLPYFLQLLGIVSLNLMVVNILPLPALDGGHLLFLFIEKIRRKALSKKTMATINSVSFALLLVLMFVVTIRDILRLF